jgi:hypothetical protein
MNENKAKKAKFEKAIEQSEMNSNLSSPSKKVQSSSKPEISKPKKKEKEPKSQLKTLDYYLTKLRSHANIDSAASSSNVSLFELILLLKVFQDKKFFIIN